MENLFKIKCFFNDVMKIDKKSPYREKGSQNNYRPAEGKRRSHIKTDEKIRKKAY